MTGVLPADLDHKLDLEERFYSTCGEIVTLTASQNFALVQFRLLPESSFELNYTRTKIASRRILFYLFLSSQCILFLACNVVSPTPSGRYRLSSDNHQQRCTFSIIYPSCISITELSLGLDRINVQR